MVVKGVCVNQAGSHGNYIHIFDENVNQILSYTPFSGWHSWPTKEEQIWLQQTRDQMLMGEYDTPLCYHITMKRSR